MLLQLTFDLQLDAVRKRSQNRCNVFFPWPDAARLFSCIFLCSHHVSLTLQTPAALSEAAASRISHAQLKAATAGK